MSTPPEVERLIEEGNALLRDIDALEEREDKEQTMGSMAFTSYRSDMYHRAVEKFREAINIDRRGAERKQ